VTHSTCSDQINCETIFFVHPHTVDPDFRMLDCCKPATLRCPSKGLYFPSPSIANLIVYLCVQSLEPSILDNVRINEICSQTIGHDHFLMCTHRFSIPTIFWRSDLVEMFSRASGTNMNSNLHVSSHANRLQAIE
jgi:hypothetical protein